MNSYNLLSNLGSFFKILPTRYLLGLLVFLALCPEPSALCQVPQGYNYQAIARDNSGNPIVNTPLQVNLIIRTDSLAGTVLWDELHSTVTTNDYGLFNVIAGKGVKQPASTVGSFSEIDWKNIPLFIQTRVYYQSQWKNMGSSRFWAVPYSMVADNLSGAVKKLTVSGETSDMEEALFEVRNKNGQTVFAVYNEGVRIYVDDGDAKGLKGGFAIGGLNPAKDAPQDLFIVSPDSIRAYIYDDPLAKHIKGGFAIGGFDYTKGITNDYLLISPDSIRAYIAPGEGKGLKGGFAIGGIDPAKGLGEEYLRVTRDSTRVYINDTPGKALKGGFAIGGIDVAKAIKPKYLSVTPEKANFQVADSLKGFSITDLQGTTQSDFLNINKINYSIGHESGLKTNPNLSIVKGKFNVFMGYKAGFSNVEGYGNIFLGHESGLKTYGGSYNVFMGFRAGSENVSGVSNVFVGYEAGLKSTQGYNLYLGQGAGKWNSIGAHNSYIGCQAGVEDGYYYDEYGMTPGSDNTFVGYRAGATNWQGNQNVYIGSYAGETNNNYSSGRVFIGYMAGRNEANGNRLYIDNSSTSSPLIYGDFTNGSERLVVNGSFNYGTDSGTANTYTVSMPSVSAYTAGMIVTFKANTACNGSACTLKINSLAAKSLFMKHDQNPSANYIEAGSIVMAVYDGTSFQMLQPAAN